MQIRPAPIAASLAAALLSLVPGCGASSRSGEPSFDAQLRLVAAGQSDTIQIETGLITGEDFGKLAKANALKALLIDNPNCRIAADGFKQIAALPALEHLRLRGRGIDDQALAVLSDLKTLRILNVPDAEFTELGLAQLKDLPELIQLRFKSPHVADGGMQVLAQFGALKRLHLIDVPITDAGLKTLAEMKQLESLYIDGAHISDAAYDELFRQRPDLHVHINQQHHDRDPHHHAH